MIELTMPEIPDNIAYELVQRLTRIETLNETQSNGLEELKSSFDDYKSDNRKYQENIENKIDSMSIKVSRNTISIDNIEERLNKRDVEIAKDVQERIEVRKTWITVIGGIIGGIITGLFGLGAILIQLGLWKPF